MFSHSITIILLFSFGYCDQLVPIVRTPLGLVTGTVRTTENDIEYLAFEGIPYAKPPIGERRFKEPEPMQKWKGTWNATTPTICAQTDMLRPSIINGVEDCLHINVYVPKETIYKKVLDVIVHIHGGAYVYGHGNLYIKPDFLMERNVILVTFNYRLGILGFLSTEDETVPGNNGLKDQVEALKWVQKNIASFGGNPKSVTLTGLSAGGSSVHYHLLSPLSKNLFHKAFSQSGSALNPWSLQKKPLRNTKKLAVALGCPIEKSDQLVKCLRQRPFQQVLDKLQLFFGYEFLPLAPFAPVVEKVANGFITENPLDIIKKGEINDIPWLSSMTSQEGLFPAKHISGNWDYYDQNWDTLAPFFFDYNDTLPEESHKVVAQKIREHYLGDKKLSRDIINDFAKIFTDRYFATGIETAVRLHAKVAESPVYLFVFGYPGDHNPQQWVTHGADARYYYGPYFIKTPLTENEQKMSKVMLDMLLDFVKTGKPTMAGVDFKPTKHDELTYVNIKKYDDITLETTKEFSQRGFWNSLNFAEGENLVLVKDEL